jgi:hypothetical protein
MESQFPARGARGFRRLYSPGVEAVNEKHLSQVAQGNENIGDAFGHTFSTVYFKGDKCARRTATTQSDSDIDFWELPGSAANFTVQMTTNFSAAWSAAGGSPVTNSATISVTLPDPTNATFYRLYQP